MSIDWAAVVFFAPFAALAVSLTALVLAILMRVRVGRIFRSANAPDLERLLKLHTKTLEEFVQFKAESSVYLRSLDQRIKEKTNRVSTIRFNPFHGGEVGGNQSFSSVFADEEGNGVVVTSIHTRERTNVFAKPLSGWHSDYELSEEEKNAITQAKKR